MVIATQNGRKYFDRKLISLIGNQRNEEVRSMLKNVAVHRLADNQQRTLLYHAALCHNPVLVQYLVDRGCEVDARDMLGYTPLSIAVRSFRAPVATRNGYIETIMALLKNGADVNARDKYNRTPLHFYSFECKNGKGLEILKILMDYGASPSLLDANGNAAFEDLFLWGDKQTMQILLRYDVDLLARGTLNRTPLHFLTDNENVNGIIKLMQGKKFDVNARNSMGETALFRTVSYADVNTVEFLLEHGADTAIANNHGETPLYAAVWHYQTQRAGREEQKSVQLLLQYGADAQHLNFEEPDRDLDMSDLHVPLLQTVLAHLAMMESQGQVLTRFTQTQINSNNIYRDYFAKCQQQLVKLKTVVVFESVTLYKLLTEHPDRIVHYAASSGFIPKFENIVKKLLGNVDSYYYHALRRRVGKAIQKAQMKLRAAIAVQNLTGFRVISHRIIVNKITDYLNGQDLKNLLYQEQELLSPLNNLFSSEH